jgi:hypothetical protein
MNKNVLKIIKFFGHINIQIIHARKKHLYG